MTNVRASELASKIQLNTSVLIEHLTTQGLPLPSFSVETPVVQSLPPEIAQAREAMVEAAEELQALVLGPLANLMRLTGPNSTLFISIQAIYRYDIAGQLPVDGEQSFGEVANRCGLSLADTKMLLRQAIAHRIFREPRKEVLAHNAMSKAIATFPGAKEQLGMRCEEMWPAAPRTLDAMSRWPGSGEPYHSGFSLSQGRYIGFFDEVQKHPERVKRFAGTMQFLQSLPSLSLSHLINNLNLDEQYSGLLVDIGGSRGFVSTALLDRFPNLRCIVHDRVEVVAEATAPPHLIGRLTFRAHDFLCDSPAPEADVYLYRSVLHNWSDDYAARILKNIIPVLHKDARIIFNEICLPEPGTVSVLEDQFIRGYDLTIKQTLNSRERDLNEWHELLGKADPRFKLQGIRKPPGSLFSIIFVGWDPFDTAKTGRVSSFL